jgi:sporulation protein YlmC with PRC-barrel domain
MLENRSLEEIKELVGREVLDTSGEPIGYVDVLFVDDDTGRPEWFGVWNGWPGGKRTLVPIKGADEVGIAGPIRLPFAREQVESAPAYDEEDDRGILRDDPDGIHISREKEQAAYAHYGIEPLTPAPAGAYVARFRALAVVRRA